MAGSAENIRIYRKMLRLDPSSRVFELLAEDLFAADELDEVVQVCRQGLGFHPGHLRPRVLLGLALMELGEHEQAEKVLLEVRDEMRKNSIIFKILADFAAMSKDHRRATQFARIYEAFHGRDLAPPAAESEEKPVGEDLPPRAETPAEEEMPVTGEPSEQPAGVEPEPSPAPPERLERILSVLGERIEARPSDAEDPDRIFSDIDRDLLKQTILAEIAMAT